VLEQSVCGLFEKTEGVSGKHGIPGKRSLLEMLFFRLFKNILAQNDRFQVKVLK